MSRLFSGSLDGLLNVKLMLRYAVQCRLRRQQYKDSLEMQVEKNASLTSLMKKQYMLLLLLGI